MKNNKVTEQNKDEIYFTWWFNELFHKGLARDCLFEPVTHMVHDVHLVDVKKFMKTKEQYITKKIFPELHWTVDYSVIMHRSLEGKMFCIIDTDINEIMIPKDFDKKLVDIYQQTCLLTTSNEIIDDEWVRVWFDVKPTAQAAQFSSSLGSSRDFKYLQRLMYDKNGIYVNKVILKDSRNIKIPTKGNTLFSKTFLPKRYRYNDVDGKLRKLKNHEEAARTIDQYLEEKEVFKTNTNALQQELF